MKLDAFREKHSRSAEPASVAIDWGLGPSTEVTVARYEAEIASAMFVPEELLGMGSTNTFEPVRTDSLGYIWAGDWRSGLE